MFVQLAATLALLAPVNAMWILSHHILNYQRLDPIVNPGTVSPHTHSIIGSNAFQPNLDFETTQTATCTTAPVQADKSSYWAQTLFHRSANGTFNLIPISFVQTYYLQRPEPGKTEVASVPKGLRMVAGDPHRSSFNESNMEDKAITFVCLDYKGTSGGNSYSFPQRNCPDGMRMQVNFPQCWDGKNLDSPDHKSHMAYPIDAPDAGKCPSSHPVKIIELFNEYVYDVGKFDFIPGQDNWVTSTGDATGYSFHADFVDGWDHSVLDPAVKQCTDNLFGDLEKCPPFVASLNRDKASACKLDAVVEEDVMSPRPKLPGCNPYTPGKAPSAMATCPGLAVPAIKGGAAASTVAGTPASSTSASPAASSTAAHSASSSPAAASSAQATKPISSSVAGTASPATSSVVEGVTSVASSVAGTATAKHHSHGINPIRTASGAHATATAISGGKQCKRDVARDAAKAAAETKYKRAVHAHHAGIKNRLSGSH